MSCTCSTGNAGPTQLLKDEHRVIEKVLDALERQLPDPVDVKFFRQVIDFLRNFADGCHHAKEENELFPVLESMGIPREQGPIGCMLDEHEMGRALIRRIESKIDSAAAGDPGAASVLRSAATAYIKLLREHINKEDNVLFVMADRVLGHEAQALMLGAFERAGKSTSCATDHRRYVDLADELSRKPA